MGAACFEELLVQQLGRDARGDGAHPRALVAPLEPARAQPVKQLGAPLVPARVHPLAEREELPVRNLGELEVAEIVQRPAIRIDRQRRRRRRRRWWLRHPIMRIPRRGSRLVPSTNSLTVTRHRTGPEPTF